MMDFLADCLRIHPLPADKRMEPLLGEPYQLALKWVEAWLHNDRVEDDLGTVMEVDAAAMSERHGQFLTPMNLARAMVRMNMGDEAPAEERTYRVLDPACGTGRLLMAAMEHAATFDQGRFLFMAVDVDIRMARCAMLNLFLTNAWRMKQGHPRARWSVAWADALRVDIRQPEAWQHANRWDAPHWSSLPPGRPLELPPPRGYFEAEPPKASAPHPTVIDAEPRRVDVQLPEPRPPRPSRQLTFDAWGSEHGR